MTNRKPLIVADIDGCCLDNSARMHYYYAGEFAKYHENWHLDRPMKAVIDLYRRYLADPNYDFLFVTSRGEQGRKYTMVQLQFHVSSNIREHQLVMRPPGCTDVTMPDTEYKPWAVINLGYKWSDVFMVIEDRNSTVAAWRALGVMCLQPQLGDF